MSQYVITIRPREELYDLSRWPHAYGPYTGDRMVEEWDRIKEKVDFERFKVTIVHLWAESIPATQYAKED
jgi:hypothetical protein